MARVVANGNLFNVYNVGLELGVPESDELDCVLGYYEGAWWCEYKRQGQNADIRGAVLFLIDMVKDKRITVEGDDGEKTYKVKSARMNMYIYGQPFGELFVTNAGTIILSIKKQSDMFKVDEFFKDIMTRRDYDFRYAKI